MSSRRTSRRMHNTNRDYPRTARLNQLLREILAEEIERIDDDRLELLTIISISADSDMRHATVFYDNLDGEAGDDDTMAALGEARIRLQAAIGRQARTKNVPELTFAPDPAVRSGARIDELLREIGPIGGDDAARAGADGITDAATDATTDAGEAFDEVDLGTRRGTELDDRP